MNSERTSHFSSSEPGKGADILEDILRADIFWNFFGESGSCCKERLSLFMIVSNQVFVQARKNSRIGQDINCADIFKNFFGASSSCS